MLLYDSPALRVGACRWEWPRWPSPSALLIPVALLAAALIWVTPVRCSAAEPSARSQLEPHSGGLSFDPGSVLSWLWSSRSEEVINSLAKPENVAYQHASTVRTIADRWLQQSEYAGAVRVNELPISGSLTILLLKRSALKKLAPQYKCDCQYVPGTSTIVCDDSFISRIITYLDSHATPNGGFTLGDVSEEDRVAAAQAMKNLYRRFMVEWIIAHEIGHFVHHDTIDSLRNACTLKDGRPVGTQIEMNADAFYISHLQHDVMDQFGAYMALSQLITALHYDLLRKRYSDDVLAQFQIPAFETKLPVRLTYEPDKHPPLLLRALTLVNSLLVRYPQMADSSGYFDRISNSIEWQFGPVAFVYGRRT